ncbi:hypothetical protein VTK73DRAFT_7231 [Phialemonium thermophilum]|uniref:Uncharacterized protein n=1 Tax=Phialemonium thermophilum TaxID=223376 RepID=A0ABR3WFT7_9PEZI
MGGQLGREVGAAQTEHDSVQQRQLKVVDDGLVGIETRKKRHFILGHIRVADRVGQDMVKPRRVRGTRATVGQLGSVWSFRLDSRRADIANTVTYTPL